MTSPNKHLYLMHSKDTHTESWVSCFGESAEEYTVLYKGKFRIFFLGIVTIIKFISEYTKNKSLLDGFLVSIISIYRIIKSFLSELLAPKK